MRYYDKKMGLWYSSKGARDRIEREIAEENAHNEGRTIKKRSSSMFGNLGNFQNNNFGIDFEMDIFGKKRRRR